MREIYLCELCESSTGRINLYRMIFFVAAYVEKLEIKSLGMGLDFACGDALLSGFLNIKRGKIW